MEQLSFALFEEAVTFYEAMFEAAPGFKIRPKKSVAERSG